MAWFRCTGGSGSGIPSSLKSDMNDVFNKKFETVLQDYPPENWPGTVNLMGPLSEKTVSGSIVTFDDGADAVLLKSCEVTIAPTLDGVSSVDVVKTGKNLVNIPDSAEITRNQLISTVVPLLDDFLNWKKGNYTISAKTAETVENANFITICINYTDGTSSSNVYIYRGSTHESGGITGTFSISSDPTKTIDSISFGGNTGTAKCAVSEWQIEANATATAYEPYVQPTTHTANLGRTIHGGSVDVVAGTGTDENGNDFTFTPVPILSRLGDNTMWGDGDLSVTYRSSGTQTIIQPTLISKTITANGTYTASDEGADGYDEVTVNVSGGGGGNTPQATQTLICDNSALGSSLTFTDDYENYDLIKFVVYRSDVQNTFVFYATPAMIDACFQYSSNRINFNQPYGNNFVCYTKTSNTSWTRYGVRNLAVQYVYGLTFTNCIVEETELYNRQGIGSGAVTFTPPTGESFLEYDYILFMTCTGNSDETQVNLEVFQPDIEKDIFGSDNVKENTVTVYRYNTGGTTSMVTDNTITSYQYFYVSGLKLNFNQQNLLSGSLGSSNGEEENTNSEEENTNSEPENEEGEE